MDEVEKAVRAANDAGGVEFSLLQQGMQHLEGLKKREAAAREREAKRPEASSALYAHVSVGKGGPGVMKAKADEVKELLELGADPNYVGEGFDRWTPLHAAVKWQTPAVVKLLVEAKANVNHRDFTGHTAVHEICDRSADQSMDVGITTKGRMEILHLLVGAKADLTIATNPPSGITNPFARLPESATACPDKGFTALDYACKHRTSVADEVREYLVANGAVAGARDPDDFSDKEDDDYF